MLAFSWALLGFLPAQSTLLLLLDLLLGLSVCWGWLAVDERYRLGLAPCTGLLVLQLSSHSTYSC